MFLAYASRFGQALIDRRLYLPDVWAQDESKRTKAGVPEEITFCNQAADGLRVDCCRARCRAPCAWVLADALYGSDSRLRRMLETREQPYVLAVRSNHCLRFWTEEGLEETNPAAMADALARDAWATHAAGEGAKGLRLYEWARIALSSREDRGTLPVAVDFDDGRVDQGIFQVGTVRDGLEQTLPDVRLHPVAKAGEDAVPVPEPGRQIAPGTAGAHNPQHRLDKKAIVLAAASGVARLAPTTRFHLRPLGVRQHKAVHPRRGAQPSTDEKRESQQTLASSRELAHPGPSTTEGVDAPL